MEIKSLCFIIAMRGEANRLIEHYQLKPLSRSMDDFLPMQAFVGNYKDRTIQLIINGRDEYHGIDNIGTQAAVLASYLAINHFKPDLIINAGTAGGIKERGLSIGDVLIAQGKAYFHDRRIPIPAFEEYGLGAYTLVDWSELIRHCGLKTGIISTGNSFDFTEIDQEVMTAVNASIKDMEAASIAWVCQMAACPLMIIKSVTDFVDLKNENNVEFVENFQLAINQLHKAIFKVVDFIITKK